MMLSTLHCIFFTVRMLLFKVFVGIITIIMAYLQLVVGVHPCGAGGVVLYVYMLAYASCATALYSWPLCRVAASEQNNFYSVQKFNSITISWQN